MPVLVLPENQRQLSSSKKQSLALVQLLILFPLMLQLPISLTVIVLFAPAYVLVRGRLNQSMAVNRWLLLSISVLVAVFVYQYYGTFRGKDAGVALIVCMYSLKLLESWKYRDFNLILTLSFFIFAMTFLFTQSFWVLPYMFLAFAVIIYVLMRGNAYASVNFSWKPAFKLLLLSAPLMVLLFLFFPRLPGPLWKMPGQQSSGSGVSDTMTPGDISTLNLIDEPAFRVKFTSDALPDRSDLYWRGLVFESYDGITWRESELRSDISKNIEQQGEVFEYFVTLEPTRQRWLFGLDVPVSLRQQSRLKSDATLVAPFRINKRIRYRVSSAPDAIISKALTPMARQINLALPEDSNEQSKQWAREQFTEAGSSEAFVDSLLQHINQEPYFYTLTPPIMEREMVDDFWFNHRSGFCEHYASSFVFMLRAAGVPARVVTGYQGGEYNQVGGYYLIKQKDAHAWSEYWVEGKGWLRVDPTSAIAPSRVDVSLQAEMMERGFLFDELPDAELLSSGWLDYAGQWFDNANSFWQEWVLDFNQDNQWDLLKWLRLQSLPSYYVNGMVLLVVFAVIYFLWRRISRQNIHLDDVAKAYQRVLNQLAKKGVSKRPDEGAKQFFSRVIKQNPDWQNQLAPILRDYQTLRYQKPEQIDGASSSCLARLKRNARNLQL